MQKKLKVGLIIGVSLLLSSCSGHGFNPDNSTCDKVERELSLMKVSGGSRKYSRSDIEKLEEITKDCEISNSLSQKDFIRYKRIVNDINSLDKDADHILETDIHDIRIK